MKIAQDLSKLERAAAPSIGSRGDLGSIVSDILPYIYGAAGIALLLYLIMGGLGLMTSAGDPKKIDASKQKITNAITGIVIVFASYWIVQLVGNLLGIDVLKNLFE